MDKQWRQYRNIVVYGIGQYYEVVKKELFQCLEITYLCDRKFDESSIEQYDGFQIISRNHLSKLKETLVVVTIGNVWGFEAVKQDLVNWGLTVVHVDEILDMNRIYEGSVLKAGWPEGRYEDVRGNRIYFDATLPDNICIEFVGCNNEVKIESNLLINNLYIRLGNNGVCKIGKNTQIIGAYFTVSDAELLVGGDCVFSTDVIIRTHDSHHIFDLNTHKRINFPKDVMIGDNVWIGHRATLLPGARIGIGSVVGEGAVTSSCFGDHVIIAGSPARCIRENICWSRENTEYFNRSYLEECKAQEAICYL